MKTIDEQLNEAIKLLPVGATIIASAYKTALGMVAVTFCVHFSTGGELRYSTWEQLTAQLNNPEISVKLAALSKIEELKQQVRDMEAKLGSN